MTAILAPVTIQQQNLSAPVPALATSVRRVGRFARLFGTTLDRNRFYKDALQAGANFFVANYVPLRFNRAYATTKLGYAIGGSQPFVDTGETKQSILANAYAFTRMGQGGAGPYALIRMMAPAKVNQYPRVLAGLRTIAPSEIRSISKHFERAAVRLARRADRHTIQRGATAGRMRLRFASPS